MRPAIRLPVDREVGLAVDIDASARLSSLGYAAGFARREHDHLVGGPDPKDAVEDHREILDAEARIGVGQRAQAAEILAAIVGRIDFVNPRALTRLAELATDEPGRETAIAARLDPDNAEVRRGLEMARALQAGAPQ